LLEVEFVIVGEVEVVVQQQVLEVEQEMQV
jgi:hypothetical protein